MPDDRTPRSPRPPAPRREEGPRTPPADPVRKAAIEVVSDRLASKRPALDKLAKPAPARLPDFPGTPAGTARRLENRPTSRARLGTPEAMLPPMPMSVPDATRADEPGEGDRPERSSTSSATTTAIRPLSARIAPPGNTSPPTDAGPPTRSAATTGGGPPAGSGGSDRRAEAAAAPDHRVPAPQRDLPRGDDRPEPAASGEPARRVDEGSSSKPTAPPDSVRVTGPVGPTRLSPPAPAGDPASRGSRTGGIAADPPRKDDAAGRPSTSPGLPRDAKVGLGTGPVGVRASLALGPRDLSGISPGSSGDPGGASSGFGGPGFGLGFGPGGDASGSPHSQPEGGMDLSKTNELLEQLLEAVRSRRDAALPGGGPSVYSGR